MMINRHGTLTLKKDWDLNEGQKHYLDTNEFDTLQKLESELSVQRKRLKSEKQKLEKIKEKIHSTQHQMEIYKHESNCMLEKMKDANWAFTKELCIQLGKAKKPPQEIAELADNFMIILGQKEKGWKTFQAITKNYNSLKALMNAFNVDNIKEETIDYMIPLWKNRELIAPKAAEYSKGATILLEWITACVEYKIKKSTLNGIKKTDAELQAKLRDQISLITEKNELIGLLEGKLKNFECTSGALSLKEEKDQANALSHTATYDSTKLASELKSNQREEKKGTDYDSDGDPDVDMVTPRKVNPVYSNNYSFLMKKDSMQYNTPTSSKESKDINNSASKTGSLSSSLQKIQNILNNYEPRISRDTFIHENSRIEFIESSSFISNGQRHMFAYSVLQQQGDQFDSFDRKKKYASFVETTPKKDEAFGSQHKVYTLNSPQGGNTHSFFKNSQPGSPHQANLSMGSLHANNSSSKKSKTNIYFV